MLSRRLFEVSLVKTPEDDGDVLFLHPSDDEFADCVEEKKIPLDPKADATLKDPRNSVKLRPDLLLVPTWCTQKPALGSFYRPGKSIVGDARALQGLLSKLQVESPGMATCFVKIWAQTTSVITGVNRIKGVQADYVLKVLSETALVCLRIITHLLNFGGIFDSSQQIARRAFILLRTLAYRRNGCGRSELQCAARNVAWFLAVQVERADPARADAFVFELLRWKRLMSTFPHAWEVVQWALQQRLLEHILILGENDDISAAFIPWYLVMETQPLTDAASLWLTKFWVPQPEKRHIQFRRNLESIRVALGLSNKIEVEQLKFSRSRW